MTFGVFNKLSYTIHLRQEYMYFFYLKNNTPRFSYIPYRCSICAPFGILQIRTAIETITADMLQTVWNKRDYHVNVCRITKGAHIEHL